MRLPKDILNTGLYTKPNFFLCHTDKEKICKLETTETKASFKFNSLSEISFDVARVYNNVITGETMVNQYYDLIEALRLIYVEGFGYFELQGPELTSDGIQEKKSCTAYSLEYTLAQRYLEDFYVNMGTTDSLEVINAASEKDIVPITLYNPNKPELSLLHLVLSNVYGWKIGHVDSSLRTLGRQFEIDRESVYDFLMNDVCEKFNCYIVFDTINNTINVYAESLTAKFIGDGETNTFMITPPFAQIGTVSVDGYKTTRWGYQVSTGMLVLEETPEFGSHIEVVDGALTEWETDVFISFDNLAQEVNINYDADDIKTKLNVTYGDDYDIREVNLGVPYLTDISYYYTVDWMGQDLYDAYTKYIQKLNSSQHEYSANSQEIIKWNDHISYEENRLSLEYSLVESVNSSTVGTYYVRRKNSDDSYYYAEVSLPNEYIADTDYYSNVTTNVDEEKVSNLHSALKEYLYSYFNKKSDGITNALNDIKELLGFDFIKGYTLSKLHNDLKSATTLAQIDSAVNKFLKELWAELGRTPLNALYLDPYKTKQQTAAEAGWSNKTNENYGRYYATVLFITSIETAISERDVTIKGYKDKQEVSQKRNAEISTSLSMYNNFTEKQLIRLSSFLREDELHIEDIVENGLEDISGSFKIKQDAMESGRIELQKMSQPRLQFSMTMANIYALSEFEPIINQFQLGKVIRVGLRPDYIKQSRLLQVDINFDDFSDFSCEFGELTNLKTQSDIHADLLSNAITAGKKVTEEHDYWTRGSDIATSTDLKIQQGLLDATTRIKAIDATQGVIIDKYGIHLTKVDPTTGETDPKQVWMVNNMILMSDDGFKTSRSALGEVVVDGQTYYGLISELVLAGYIEGSRLVGGTISSTNYEEGKQGTHFDLENGDFDIAGGRIVYDTDKNLLTLKDVTINWDTTNDIPTSSVDGLDKAINDAQTSLDDAIKNLKKYSDDSEQDAKDYADEQDITLSSDLTTAYEKYTNTKVSTLDKTVADYLGVGGGTLVGNSFVISPYIGGGYLNITNTSNKSRVIIDPNNLTKNGYIFQVHNGKSVTVGVDSSGNASFAGKITATSLTLSGCTVSTNDISGLSSVATSGKYSDLTGKPTIPSSVADLGLDTSKIIYKGDIKQSTKTDSNGISYLETVVPTTSGSIKYSTYDADNYIVFGRSKGTNSSGKNYVCISKDGLLTARNALIYGTVYATDGEFAGKITADTGTIAGWNITDNAIYKNQYDSTSNKTYSAAVRSGSSTSSVAFALYEKSGKQTEGPSINNDWTYDFYVGYNGKLYAKNADITGKITATSGEFKGNITGGTININNTFKVDTSGNVTMDSGGTIKITADKGENSYINFGEAFAVSKGGLSATSGTFKSLTVGGKKVLTEDSFSSKIVVSKTKPTGSGIIWICPSAASNVKGIEYKGYTADTRDTSLNISSVTKSFGVSCNSSDTLPSSTYKYTVRFPVALIPYDSQDATSESNVKFNVVAKKSNTTVTFPTYTLSSIKRWETKNIEISVETTTNLCANNSDITISISTQNVQSKCLFVDKESYIYLNASDTKATSTDAQSCTVSYIP